MKKFLAILVGIISGFLLGCINPVLEPLPTYTPYPSPDARVVLVTPTPVPDEGWSCFTGAIRIVDGSRNGVEISVVGEQVICAKEWKISNLYGPVGSLESNPGRPLKFKDLNEMVDVFSNVSPQGTQ